MGGGRRGGNPRSTRARQVCRVVDDSASARRLIPECRIRESVSPAPSDRFGQCAKTGLQPSAPECTLAGPLIIYPYWTQFTLKLTGSRLVSPAKLTSKLTIYSRSIPLSSLSLSLSPTLLLSRVFLFPLHSSFLVFSFESISRRRRFHENFDETKRARRSKGKEFWKIDRYKSSSVELEPLCIPFSLEEKIEFFFTLQRSLRRGMIGSKHSSSWRDHRESYTRYSTGREPKLVLLYLIDPIRIGEFDRDIVNRGRIPFNRPSARPKFQRTRCLRIACKITPVIAELIDGKVR